MDLDDGWTLSYATNKVPYHGKMNNNGVQTGDRLMNHCFTFIFFFLVHLFFGLVAVILVIIIIIVFLFFQEETKDQPISVILTIFKKRDLVSKP